MRTTSYPQHTAQAANHFQQLEECSYLKQVFSLVRGIGVRSFPGVEPQRAVWLFAAVLQFANPLHAQSWVQRLPQHSPTTGYGHTLTYDPARHEIVMFGGATSTGKSQSLLDGTWTWDGVDWATRNVVSPPARSFHAVAFDSWSGQLLLFGGYGYQGICNDTWAWDGKTWTAKHPLHHPAARFFHGMAFDEQRGQIVLFGGQDMSGQVFNDTWVWNGADWVEQVTTLGPARAPGRAAMVYDGQGKRILLLGALQGVAPEVWTWDGTGWTRLAHTTADRLLVSPLAIFDNLRQRVWFGFEGPEGIRGGRWDRGTQSYQPASLAIGPKLLAGSAVAFDTAHDQFVLLGAGANDVAETWIRSDNSVQSGRPSTGNLVRAASRDQLAAAPPPQVRFPLADVNAYTAKINTVLDHAVDTAKIIVGYTGERGRSVDHDWVSSENSSLHGYGGYSDDHVHFPTFLLNGSYCCGSQAWYEREERNTVVYQHPGYDYHAPSGTQIIAPVDGELWLVKQDTYNPSDNAWCDYHVFKIKNSASLETRVLHALRFVNMNDPGAKQDLEAAARRAFQNNYQVCTTIKQDIKIANVTAGEPVAYVGGWGRKGANTFPVHLHFETRKESIQTGGDGTELTDAYGWEGDSPDPLTSNGGSILWDGYTAPLVSTLALDKCGRYLTINGNSLLQPIGATEVQIWRRFENNLTNTNTHDGTFVKKQPIVSLFSNQIVAQLDQDVIDNLADYVVKVGIDIDATIAGQQGPRSQAKRLSDASITSCAQIVASPSAQSVQAGDTATYSITLTRVNLTDPVNLHVSGFPVGLTAIFTPPAPTGNSALLSVGTAFGIPSGTVNLTIDAVAVGVVVYPATIALTITPNACAPNRPGSRLMVAARANGCPPVLTASCSASQNPVATGQPTTFTAAIDGGVPPYSAVWTGDISGTGLSITQTFGTPGTYTATLTASDTNNPPQSSTTTCTVQVMPTTPLTPTISNIGVFGNAVANNPFDIIVSGANFVVGQIQAWLFGTTSCQSGCRQPDAGVINLSDSSMTLHNVVLVAGDYYLKARNSDAGAWSNASSTFTVIPQPTLLSGSCSITPNTMYLGQGATVTATALGGTPPYQYLMGNAGGWTSSNTVAVLPKAVGTFTYPVSIRDNGAQLVSTSCTAQVLAPPPLSVSCYISPNPILLGNGATVYASAAGGLAPYMYVINGVNMGGAGSLFVIPQQVGTYTATTAAADTSGQQAQTTCSAQVQGVPPQISGYTWNTPPRAGQNFSGTIAGSGFVSGIGVFFCITGTNTCYQQPPAGVIVYSLTSVAVNNVNLSTGSWQLYVQTQYGTSARSGAFTVSP